MDFAIRGRAGEARMGPESDIEGIREIYRAEREADRIVREAGDEAGALVEAAEKEARSLLEAKRIESARLAEEALAREVAEIEKEARAFVENARLRTEAWVRRSEPEIDSVACALVDRVLPP